MEQLAEKLTENSTEHEGRSGLGPTEEKLYLGLGLGTGLLVILVILVIVAASIVQWRKMKKTGGPRIGRFYSVANSDFETYNAINPDIFSTPSSRSVWDHRQVPSSPTPTITTVHNDFYGVSNDSKEMGQISMKIMNQMFGPKQVQV